MASSAVNGRSSRSDLGPGFGTILSDTHPQVPHWVALSLSLAWVVFQLLLVPSIDLEIGSVLGLHIAFALTIAFVASPARHADRSMPSPGMLTLGTLSAAALLLLILSAENGSGFVDAYTSIWLTGGVLLAISAATWRHAGAALPVAAVTVITVLMVQQSPAAVVDLWRSIIGVANAQPLEALGMPLQVAALDLFVLFVFAAVLEQTGAPFMFGQLARSVTGKSHGSCEKALIVSSLTTGKIATLWSPRPADGLAAMGEHAALSNPRQPFTDATARFTAAAGRWTPPAMGATAFMIAHLIGQQYSSVALGAIVPALLLLGAAYLFVHLLTRYYPGLAQRPTRTLKLTHILVRRWHQIVPCLTFFVGLLLGASAIDAGLLALSITGILLLWSTVVTSAFAARPQPWVFYWGLIALFGAIALFGDVVAYWVLSALIILCASDRALGRHVLLALLQALSRGALGAVPISLICAQAAIAAGALILLGVPEVFTAAAGALAGNWYPLFVALILALTILIGRFLPVLATYLIAAVVFVPCLQMFGTPLLTAHLMVFFCATLADIPHPLTPQATATVRGPALVIARRVSFAFAILATLVCLVIAFSPELSLDERGPLIELLGYTGALVYGALKAAALLTLGAVVLARWIGGRLRFADKIVGVSSILLLVWPLSSATQATLIATFATDEAGLLLAILFWAMTWSHTTGVFDDEADPESPSTIIRQLQEDQ